MKVVLICGVGRSGTTVFGKVISHVLEAFNVGEMIYLRSRSIDRDQLCGCGRKFSECEFWSNVLQADPEFAENARIVESHARWRYLPAFVLNMLGLKNDRTRRAAEALTKMYATIAQQSGTDTIVDSSKMIPYAFLLMNTRITADYFLVVRNAVDVIKSTQKAKYVPEWGRKARLHKRSAIYYIGEWLLFLVFMAAIRVTRRRSVFVGYKQYVCDHQRINQRFWNGAKPINFGVSVEVPCQHDVGGNPNRFGQKIHLKTS